MDQSLPSHLGAEHHKAVTVHVLLVDDDASLLRAWRRVLRAPAFALTTAQTQGEVKDLLRQHSLDLDVALVDLVLANGPSGFDVLADIRVQFPHAALALISAHLERRRRWRSLLRLEH
jgi:DNA-binding response OmpR family regulator